MPLSTIARRLAVFGILATVPLTEGCGPADTAPPADRFFRGVMAGHSQNGPISATFDILVYSPDLASQRKPGSRGSNPNELDADGLVFLDNTHTFAISGGYDKAGNFVHCASGGMCDSNTTVPGLGSSGGQSGGTWTFDGSFQGGTMSGTFTGPNGAAGTFAGEDSAHESTALLCGTYSGAASGIWNFVIAQEGAITGAFAGDASGMLNGDASGSKVTLSWSGTDGFGAAASGSASGSLSGSVDSASNSVSGWWQGADGSKPVSGSFTTDAMACPGPPPPAQVPASSACPCDDIPAQGPNFPGACCGARCCSVDS
jgi:hypothetical protein